MRPHYFNISSLLCLFSLLLCLQSFGQADNYGKANTPLDSVLLEEFLLEKNRETLIPYELGLDINSLSAEQVDSICWESRHAYYESKLYYSPDSLFKIFVAQGEGCGAYCNSVWSSSILHLTSCAEFDEPQIKNVQAIHRLPDEKYLILHYFHGRPASVYTNTSLQATLISFEADQLIHHPIAYQHPKPGFYDEETDLILSQENFVFGNQQMEYDSSTQQLRYDCGMDFSICCLIDSAFQFSGSFEYQAGEFVHLGETKTYIELEE